MKQQGEEGFTPATTTTTSSPPVQAAPFITQSGAGMGPGQSGGTAMGTQQAGAGLGGTQSGATMGTVQQQQQPGYAGGLQQQPYGQFSSGGNDPLQRRAQVLESAGLARSEEVLGRSTRQSGEKMVLMENHNQRATTHTVDWQFQLDGILHTVNVTHDSLLGKRKIYCDGIVKEEFSKFFETGSNSQFMIGDHTIEVVVDPRTLAFAYELRIDGTPVSRLC